MDQKTQSEIGPQPGPQTQFAETKADIAIYGGAAGGGKTFSLLLEPLRHYDNPLFGAVIFRRTTVQIRNEGSLWDEAGMLYPKVDGQLFDHRLEVVFPTGMRVKFAHLEHEKNVYDWQGAQIPLIEFDELTHFTPKQFWYMLSRNRSMSGVPGYIRAGCNPDADSWVKEFIAWWINPDTGQPIKERIGVLRWFVRIDDELHWADTKEALIKTYGKESEPKSVTFIAANVYDNKILMEKDPAYLANLKALSRVERMRLLGGDWNVRPTAGMYFQKSYFEVIDKMPAGGVPIRYWDRASTKPSAENKDPDHTVGLKLRKYSDGTYIVEHVERIRDTPLQVERTVKNTASQDGQECWIGVEQDPGSAGVADAGNYVKLLAGYNVRVNKPTQDKITRALPVSAQAEAGNIKVLRGPWNDAFFTEVENFPPPDGTGHDDQVDAFSGAFNELVKRANDDWMPISLTGQNKFAM